MPKGDEAGARKSGAHRPGRALRATRPGRALRATRPGRALGATRPGPKRDDADAKRGEQGGARKAQAHSSNDLVLVTATQGHRTRCMWWG